MPLLLILIYFFLFFNRKNGRWERFYRKNSDFKKGSLPPKPVSSRSMRATSLRNKDYFRARTSSFETYAILFPDILTRNLANKTAKNKKDKSACLRKTRRSDHWWPVLRSGRSRRIVTCMLARKPSRP